VAAAFGTTLAERDELSLYRSAGGPWADVSRRFAEATEGKVRILPLDPDTNMLCASAKFPG
jgi:hypothetical protein